MSSQFKTCITSKGTNPSKATENSDGDHRGRMWIQRSRRRMLGCGCNRHLLLILAGKLEGTGRAGQLPDIIIGKREDTLDGQEEFWSLLNVMVDRCPVSPHHHNQRHSP